MTIKEIVYLIIINIVDTRDNNRLHNKIHNDINFFNNLYELIVFFELYLI